MDFKLGAAYFLEEKRKNAMKELEAESTKHILNSDTTETLTLSIHPITRNVCSDFEELFGANGACGGCWCMFWRLPRRDLTPVKERETNER